MTIDKENAKIQQLNEELLTTNQTLQNTNSNLNYEKDSLSSKIDILQKSLNQMSITAEEAAQAFYKAAMQNTCASFEASAEKERQKYLDTIKQYDYEIEQIMQESAKNFSEMATKKRLEIEGLEDRIAGLKLTFENAVAAEKRIEEIKLKADIYKIQLSDIDKEEIQILRELTKQLRNPEPLNKVIWKMYFEKPTNDLINRVIGTGVHCGIYKITDPSTSRCYVGQSVNLADRWKQHIKRGLGAEAATKNKLYPALSSIGVENFTFEVIEECDRANLDEREDFWQDYFHAKDFGYSIK